MKKTKMVNAAVDSIRVNHRKHSVIAGFVNLWRFKSGY